MLFKGFNKDINRRRVTRLPYACICKTGSQKQGEDHQPAKGDHDCEGAAVDPDKYK